MGIQENHVTMLSEQLNEVTLKLISLHTEKTAAITDLEMEQQTSQSLSRKLSLAETDVKVTTSLIKIEQNHI